MTTQSTYLALFDLDRTILSINSGSFLVWQSYKSGLMNFGKLARSFYLALLYKFDLKETTKIIEEMTDWLKGVKENDLKELANIIIEQSLIKKIRAEIYSEIQHHKKNGAAVIMLSASLPIICMPIAAHLGLDDVICSHAEIIDGKYSGRPVGRLCFGEEKLVKLKEYCAQSNFQINDAYYYADSISDIFVFNAVGYPVVISPLRKLRKLALKKNWQLHNWE